MKNTVLVVDDNANVRAGVRTLLEKAELSVCGEACDGAEAIQKAVEQKPNVIVMDLSMPNLNGAAAASVIRSLVPDTRIVMFTMFADSFGESSAKHLGVDMVISKNDGAAVLLNAIRKCLASPAQAEKPTN
ncbi:MAG TPA: response regulator transcription factor [Candidatus Acidoferrales bacterium]|nr:response regulator transcription factor [Candidatus Acidoferrales bacterium]